MNYLQNRRNQDRVVGEFLSRVECDHHNTECVTFEQNAAECAVLADRDVVEQVGEEGERRGRGHGGECTGGTPPAAPYELPARPTRGELAPLRVVTAGRRP